MEVFIPLNHIHIWQVSPQLSCIDICQIWFLHDCRNSIQINISFVQQIANTLEMLNIFHTLDIINLVKFVDLIVSIWKYLKLQVFLGCMHIYSVMSFPYNDVIMSATASQITSITIVYSIVRSGAHQRKHQSSASSAFFRGIHRWPANSPHKGPVTRKMFPFDDVIMLSTWTYCNTP